MKKGITDKLAEKGIVALIEHIKRHGAKSITYFDFAKMVGCLDKNGRTPMFIGMVLGKVGDYLRHYPGAPYITILVESKTTGKSSSGFSYFVENWNDMNSSQKEKFVAEERAKIEDYRRLGKFDKFLPESARQANAAVEFASQQEDGDYTVADGVTARAHREFEYKIRNQKIVADKKKKSDYTCECCGFNFWQVYGILGKSYIECHHIKPLAKSESGEKIELKDLAALCANCHRMIHRLLADNKDRYKNNYPQSIKDLRGIVEKHR